MAALQTWDEIVASTLDSDSTIREDLQDAIYNVTPSRTPLLSRLRQVGVNQNYVQWLVDAFAAAADDAWLEGIAFTAQDLTVPTRAANTTQIFYKGGSLSDRSKNTVHAGMADPISYYEGKKLISMKKNMELALVKGSAATGSSNVASRMGGFMNILSTNKTAVSGITMTETIFNNLLELAWTNTEAMPTDVYVGTKLKRTISGYTTSVTRNISAEEKKQILTINQYDSEFGSLNIHFHRDLANVAGSAELLCIDPNYFATGWLQSLKREVLSRDGKRDRFQISGEFTLLYGNEKAGLAASQLQANI
jgi:hypothetical protein